MEDFDFSTVPLAVLANGNHIDQGDEGAVMPPSYVVRGSSDKNTRKVACWGDKRGLSRRINL